MQKHEITTSLRKYEIVAGLGFDKDGKELDPVDVAETLRGFENSLILLYNGFTRVDATGGFYGVWEVREEPCAIYILFASTTRDVRISAKGLQYKLKQESVCLVLPDNTVEFVS